MVFGKINDAYETVKNGLSVEIDLATAEQKEKLADAKIGLAELKDLIADLKDENRQLRDQIKLKDSVRFGRSGVAWVGDEPYCGGCLGSKGTQVHLKRHNDSTYDCPTCKAIYMGVNRDAPS
jgi:hypothetical protein